jgi:Ca2+-binding RTX toxin-like protein
VLPTSWLFGGDGLDTADYSLAMSGVTVDLLNTSLNGGDAAGHVYIGIEQFSLSNFDDVFIGADTANSVLGGYGDDQLTGGRGDDILDGGAGDDFLVGGDGNDILRGGTAHAGGHHGGDVGGDDNLYGGNGNDLLDGGVGNDWLDGGAGADTIAGGDGFDVADYSDATAGVSIDLTKASSTWTGDAQGDILTSIEGFQLSSFADIFRGDANANSVSGGAGDDQISGLGGNDTLYGEAGNDSISGGDGNDVVYGDNGPHRGGGGGWHHNDGDDYLQGNAGDDTLYGGGGNDRMVGGTGNDILVGGLGGDYMVGNEGADVFTFTAVEDSQHTVVNGANQLDTIVDFTQGEDTIDLSAIDANPNVDGDQAFTFIADPAHYTGDWTGVVWQTTAANGIATINVSVDGDADPEMQIYMSHAYHFTASDFVL